MSRTAAQALGYRELLAHVRGEIALHDAVDLAVIRTRRFAVRQERWFRRDPRITWFDVDESTGTCESVALNPLQLNPLEYVLGRLGDSSRCT